MLFFINVFCPLVPWETICFHPSTDAVWHFSIYRSAPIQRATQAYCPVCYSVFFCLRYSALFSMERLLPEWMPQALWVLKEVSLLRQCVDSPSLFETRFWSIHKPFFWDFLWHVSVEAFPLWARRCDAWYSCQCFWCTPCNRWSWDSITLSASWGNIFAAPQILTWYAAVLNCKDSPALHGVRKPLCACRHKQRTC